jgi:exonuclease SbcC
VRPLALTLRGFRSHDSETVLSFTGRRLFAIVGPTGAGKSSILDAISFALYGATPAIRSHTRKLISTRSDSAHVRFTFSVEGDDFEITRTLRTRGQGEHVLVDLSSGDQVLGEAKVNAKVIDLLGLDFDAFCSSVLLAQGRFAEFLRASPSIRSQILKGVFRLDQIDALREEAKKRRDELVGQLNVVKGKRAHIPENLAELLEEATRARASAVERVGALEKAAPDERRLLDTAERSADALSIATGALAAAREALEAAPALRQVQDLAATEKEVAGPLAAATKALAQAASAREAAAAAVARAEGEVGNQRDLIEAKVQARTLNEETVLLEAHVAAVAAAEAKVSAAAGELQEAVAFEQQALDSLEKIRAEREDVERAHRAHALRDVLAVGEPCPVCEQEVTTLPKGERPAELAVSRAAEAEAGALHQRATAAAREAEKSHAAAETELATARRRLADEQAELTAARAALTKIVGAVEDPLAEVERRLELLADAGASLAEATDELEEARREVERCSTARAEVASAVSRVVARLSHVAGTLSLAPPAHDATAADLVEATVTLRRAAEKAAAASEAAMRKAEEAAELVRRELGELRSSLGLDAAETVEDAIRRAIRSATEAEGEEKRLTGMVEESEVLDRQEEQLNATLALYRQLADDMTDKNFIKYMLEEKRRLLSDIGSQRLREMTRRYRFDDRGDFDVVDELDGDKERTVDTLSGGETFLASLALSLALAEAVTRHGGRLQCFFLDEGFGSLDADALDSALEGIEHIVTEDRLIGLVSHVEALRNRIEDKIVLDKDDDGTTRVIAGSTLG